MADLAVWLFQQTAIDLLIRPWSDEEEQMLQEGLPEPMYKGGNAIVPCASHLSF